MRKRWDAVLWAGLVVTGAIGALSREAVLAAERRSDVPEEVVANALIARENMRRIALAIYVYQNDNNDRPPPTLSHLYPEWISDPLVFWHPGDSDAPPTTIDNDVPNAPNSARISFDLDLALFEPWACPGEQPLIADNSPLNNGGLFTSQFFNVGWPGEFYTDPPGMLPTPTASLIARWHLRNLALAAIVYANNETGWFPSDAIQLLPGLGHPCLPARVVWHPGDDQPMPTQITNAVLNAPDSVQMSFQYLVAGQWADGITLDTPLFRDISPAYNGGCGTWAALYDYVRFEWLCPADLNGDGAIDALDLMRLATSFGDAGEPCFGDCDLDGTVDILDYALLQQRCGADCP